MKVYYLYQKSKRCRELKAFSEIFEKSKAKPAKAFGTGWANHRLKAMETFVANYGAYILHLESLSQTDSVPARQELKGWLSKLMHVKYPMLMTVYIDILMPFKVRTISKFDLNFDAVILLPMFSSCKFEKVTVPTFKKII